MVQKRPSASTPSPFLPFKLFIKYLQPSFPAPQTFLLFINVKVLIFFYFEPRLSLANFDFATFIGKYITDTVFLHHSFNKNRSYIILMHDKRKCCHKNGITFRTKRNHLPWRFWQFWRSRKLLGVTKWIFHLHDLFRFVLPSKSQGKWHMTILL